MAGEEARTQAFWPLLPPSLAHARILEWKDHKAWLQGPAGLDTQSLGDGELHPGLGGRWLEVPGFWEPCRSLHMGPEDKRGPDSWL